MINGSDQTKSFGIFEGHPGQWKLTIDTSLPDTAGEGTAIDDQANESQFNVAANSVVVLVRSAETRY